MNTSPARGSLRSILARARGWIGIGICLTPFASLHSAQFVGHERAPSLTGSLYRFRVSPDGAYVVYDADLDEIYGLELYGVPTDGSASPIQYGRTLVRPFYLHHEWRISGLGRVVFVIGGALLSAPLDGSAPAIVIAGVGCPFCDDSDFAMELGADGMHVLYRSEESHLDPLDPLYAVPVDGGRPAVQLSDPGACCVSSFGTTPDGTRALFTEYDTWFRFRCRAIDGASPAVDMNEGLSHVAPFLYSITPDGSVVAFSAFRFSEGHGVYSSPIDGGSPPVRISGAVPQYVDALEIDPSASRALYMARAIPSGHAELFSAPLDGGVPPTRLSHALASDGDVTGFEIGPDGTRVVYRARENGVQQLYGVDADGSRPPVRLSGRLVAGGQVLDAAAGPSITPDGRRVVYVADAEKDGLFGLYVVSIDGGRLPSLRWLPSAHDGRVERFRIDPSGARVVYEVRRSAAGTDELYSLPLDGRAPALQLNAAAPPGSIDGFELTADGRAVFLQGGALYVVPIDLRRPPLALTP